MSSARCQGGFLRRLAPPLSLLCLLFSPLAFADQVVYFVNGKAIMVKSVEKGDRITTLEMEGGGRIGVPTEQIARIEEYQISAPSAVAAPPVAAAAPPAPVVAQPPVAAAAPAVAPVPAGPGFGGAPSPGQDLARMRPINLGGEEGRPRVLAPYRQGEGAAGPSVGGPGRAGPGATLVGAGPNGPGRRGGRAGAFRRGGRGGRAVPGYDQAAQPQAPPPAPPYDPNPPVAEENTEPGDGANGAQENDPPVEVAPPSDSAPPEEE